MIPVILESPFAGETKEQEQIHIEYAKLCMKDCLLRNEAPMVSHLLYTQVLDDNKKDERKLGISAGLTWCYHSKYTVVYTDYGISKGMKLGIEYALQKGKKIIYRSLKYKKTE